MSRTHLVKPFTCPADPAKWEGRRIGVLFSHGFTGSPASMRPWADHFYEHGVAVELPLLPGHATTWRDMNVHAWREWYDEAEAGFEKLRANCDRVFVAGLSMGGCLALRLAEQRGREVAGVMLVNPAINLEDKRLLLLPVLKRLMPSFPGIGNDIKKPGQDEQAYDRTPLRALASQVELWKLTRDDLPKVTQPLLLFRSAEDHVVDPSSSRIILSRVSSRDLQERVLENSYHVATLDNDAPAIFTESLEFIRRVTGP